MRVLETWLPSSLLIMTKAKVIAIEEPVPSHCVVFSGPQRRTLLYPHPLTGVGLLASRPKGLMNGDGSM